MPDPEASNVETQPVNLTDGIQLVPSVNEEEMQNEANRDQAFPEELNRFLRNRIQALTIENGNLRDALEKAEEKLCKQESLVQSQCSVSLEKSSEMASTKIVELSRKCRERTAETEVLKSKCKLLEERLASTEAQLENKKQKLKCLESSLARTSPNSGESDQSKQDEDQVRLLTEKLHQTQMKLYEAKNACTVLKQDLNKAQKLLCSEIGDNVSVSSLSSGWRGRAEQIRLLQQKVTELQSRLANYEGTSKMSTASIDRKNLSMLRNIEKERRQQMENSAKELRQVEVALETSKRKLEASKARIKVLEHELNVLKGHISVLNEKRYHDDCLIETLNSRLKAAETKYQEREAEIRNREEKWGRESMNAKNDLQAAQLQIDRLRKRLEEREVEIDKLRSGIIPDIDRIKLQRPLHPEIYPNDTSRTSPPSSFRSSSDPNEYVTLALAAEAERERLLELVTVLNRRVEKERSEADIISESLRNEKTRAGKLEIKLRKIEAERMSLKKVDSGYRSGSLYKSSKSNDELGSIEHTRLKLELLQEECLALKARLDTVQQDKAADLATYKRMLDQTRKIFQDACRNKYPCTAGSRSIITI